MFTETDVPEPSPSAARVVAERAAVRFASRSVRSSVVRRSPSVHGDGDRAFIPILIAIAREKRVSAYVGDGRNRWPAVHRLDAANLFRLALEGGTAGSTFHGVADERIATREIAEVIGRQLNVPVVSVSPEEATMHFSWLAGFRARLERTNAGAAWMGSATAGFARRSGARTLLRSPAEIDDSRAAVADQADHQPTERSGASRRRRPGRKSTVAAVRGQV